MLALKSVIDVLAFNNYPLIYLVEVMSSVKNDQGVNGNRNAAGYDQRVDINFADIRLLYSHCT
jgi:hypothetical protein